MSLDVALYGPERDQPCRCTCGHEHARRERPCLYDANITHNLNRMADEAGIYEHVWRPEEIGVTTAGSSPRRSGPASRR